MMKRISIGIFLFAVILMSCSRSNKNRFRFSVDDLPPEALTILNYGKALFEADTNNLQEELYAMQHDFLPFLDADLSDSSNIRSIRNFITDTTLRRLYEVSTKVFPEPDGLSSSLTAAVRRYHYHFPEAMIPDYYLYISGVHHEVPVMAGEDAVVVATDCYLGQDFDYYQKLGIPMYRISRMTPEHIVNDILTEMYVAYIETTEKTNTVLDEMIRAGKRLFFLQAMQPELAENILIGYHPEQLSWAENHEGELWAFLIGEDVLYSSDFLMIRKLFGDGPFTQDFSTEAPARLGEWTGWQIVRKFADRHPDLSLAQIMNITDSQKILEGSKYKPKR